MNCIFCKIAKHEIPTSIVYESKSIIAFTDISPKAPVHILIIPKKHIESIATTSEKDSLLLGEMVGVAKIIAKEKDLSNGFRLVFNVGADSGAEVPHLHMHLLGGNKLRSMA